MTIETINPASGKRIQSYTEFSDEVLFKRIEKAHKAYQNWSTLTIEQRSKPMFKLAKVLRENNQKFARLISIEMGKPITQALAEIEKCAWNCEYYAAEAADYLAPKIIKTEMQESSVHYKPLGVIFSIMPWNFPFWQVFRFAAPNLMAGNVGMLSHAPITTGCALAIEQTFIEAGFPEGVFTALLIDIPQSAKVIAHPLVKGVTLTGSERAGIAVAGESAKNIKKCVLELGGSDPYLILQDADIKQAAETCVNIRMMNAGQICISPKRLIVVENVYHDFVAEVSERLKAFAPGDPLDENCTYGPMARADLRDELASQVEESIHAGAKCLLGGEKVAGDGYYFQPTLLVDVKPGMPAHDAELFGPVIAIIKAKDEADAIRIANDSPFGLGAAVFTADVAHGKEIATNQLNAGTCVVNTFVGSDPRLPFGGINLSGYGRECATEGIHEFLNVKTVNVK